MTRRVYLSGLGLAVMILLVIASCTRSIPYVPWELSKARQGPHSGHLMELGVKDAWVELVHDKRAGKLTIYVLDDPTLLPVTPDSNEITLDLRVQGEDHHFVLAPVAGGKGNEFASTDQVLIDAFEREQLKRAKLTLQALSKEYVVEFDHTPHAEQSATPAPGKAPNPAGKGQN